jgi:hypothetical protein
MFEEPSDLVDGPSTPLLEDVKLMEKFLSLAKRMIVALVDTEASSPKCTGIGFIKECSFKRIWSGLLVPHSFFVIVQLHIVNSEYRNHVAHCKFLSVQTLACVVGQRTLWSGYKVRSLHADRTSP